MLSLLTIPSKAGSRDNMTKLRETRIRVGIELYQDKDGNFAPGFKTIEDYLDSLGVEGVSEYWAVGFAEDDIHKAVFDLLNSDGVYARISYQSPNVTQFCNIGLSGFTDKLRYRATCKYWELAQEGRRYIEFLVTVLPIR